MSDIEHKLLSILVEDPNEIERAWEAGVRAEVFEDPQCRAVFILVISYWQNHRAAPTRYVVDTELPGFVFVDNVEEAPHWLAEQLRRRFVINAGQTLLVEAAGNLATDPIGTLRSLYAGAYTATETVASGLTRSTMTDVDARRERYLERATRHGGSGLPLGIPELDAHTGGLMPGELAAVGGHPKQGKSFLLVNAAVAQRKAGFAPILFTLEMSIAEMEDRVDALFSGVSYNRLSRSRLTDAELERYKQGQEQLAEMGGIQIESSDIGDRTVSAILNRARQARADFVLIDQLSHMEASRSTRDLKEHHANVMKGLSTELSRPGQELPCLIAAQLRRPDTGGRGADAAPATVEMHHFANAAEIEREVDLALGLSCTVEERRNNTKRIHILAGRRCSNKSWLLNWQLTEQSRIEVISEL